MKLSPSDKKPSVAAKIIVVLTVCACLYYMGWASRISARTVLMPEIPELATYLLISSVTGLIAVVRTRYKRSEGKTVKQTLNCFAGWFCVGFVFSLNIYAAAIYILPGEVISYESDYEITYPGPPIGKMGHCEAGLWIKDTGTHRRIALCTNKAKLDEDIKQGMTAVWVNARTNKLGSYIMNYTFIYSNQTDSTYSHEQ